MKRGAVFLSFLLIGLALTLQCARDDQVLPANDQESVYACDPSGFAPAAGVSCEEDPILPADLFCAYQRLAPVDLFEPTRHQLKYLCEEVRQVTFANEAGSFVTFPVRKVTTRWSQQTNGPCPDGDGRETLRCVELEVAYVTLANPVFGLEFRIGLEPILDHENLGHHGDRLEIARVRDEGPEYGKVFDPVLSYTIDSTGERRPGQDTGTRFDEMLTLGGERYMEVFSSRSSGMEIYYNASRGVLAFRDSMFWTFREFN